MSEPKKNSKSAFGWRETFILICAVGFISLASVILNYGKGLSHRTSSTNACINNLRIIDAAKQQWALEKKKTATDVPTWGDLKSYLGSRDIKTLKCPLGGIYTIGRVSELPTCSIGTNSTAFHVLTP
jgi:hypothetical protein